MNGPEELSSLDDEDPVDEMPRVGNTLGAISGSAAASCGSWVVGRTFPANNTMSRVKSDNCDERGLTNRHSPESERGSRAAEARSI